MGQEMPARQPASPCPRFPLSRFALLPLLLVLLFVPNELQLRVRASAHMQKIWSKNSLKILPFGANFRLETTPAEMHKITAAPPSATAPGGALEAPLAAPKYGTLIPNRIFVGGISGDTTEADLTRVFSAYGTVKSTKIIVDRAGVSKGYGFVTFETEQEAQRLQADGECVVLRDRKLNIAPAIKKQPNPLQSIVTTNGAVYYTTTPPAPISNIPMDQFAAAVYPPDTQPQMPHHAPPHAAWEFDDGSNNNNRSNSKSNISVTNWRMSM
ncbi:hypothetical protein KR222_002785 [Zaprionus bogoriensis]|nr:hypothetical protein KR222_002785 [Zaprionus bogoriensis]